MVWSFRSRIDELIDWYVKFKLDVACFYFHDPDATGHTFGPDSQEYKDKVKQTSYILFPHVPKYQQNIHK